jgi:hypothetical protein
MQADLWQGLHYASAAPAKNFIFQHTYFLHLDNRKEPLMVAAENFVAELDTKNQTSIQRVVDALSAAVGKDGVEVPDALRFALKATIESAEVAALWIPDCDDLEMKLSLAEQCGDSARQCRKLSERLLALGVAGYDPRDGGYSKLFAFLRSLQTTEERSSAGYLTGRALSMARLGALAGFCERQGDADSARLLGVEIMTQERRYYEHGKQILVGAVATEESQARARRAAYRTLELAGETLEPLQLRKALGKRR